MDDVVAFRVRLTNGEDRFLLTWGRVFDPIDGRLLAEKVKEHLGQFSLGGEAKSIEMCDALRAAAGAKYFFEAFFAMCQKRVPFGPGYEEWAIAIRAQVETGREIYYLGANTP